MGKIKDVFSRKQKDDGVTEGEVKKGGSIKVIMKITLPLSLSLLLGVSFCVYRYVDNNYIYCKDNIKGSISDVLCIAPLTYEYQSFYETGSITQKKEFIKNRKKFIKEIKDTKVYTSEGKEIVQLFLNLEKKQYERVIDYVGTELYDKILSNSRKLNSYEEDYLKLEILMNQIQENLESVFYSGALYYN